jgi:two-component system chemotaxis response regulator CheY
LKIEKLNVMVVDDSSTVRRLFESILKQLGHKVVATADNGAAAITAFNAYKPDLVIMDITMPVMDGIEATEKILAVYPDARIIVATSHTTKDVVLKARSAGARGYILKPVNPDRLRGTIETTMRI